MSKSLARVAAALQAAGIASAPVEATGEIRTAEAAGGMDRKGLTEELFSGDYLIRRPLLEAMEHGLALGQRDRHADHTLRTRQSQGHRLALGCLDHLVIHRTGLATARGEKFLLARTITLARCFTMTYHAKRVCKTPKKSNDYFICSSLPEHLPC